VIEAVSSLPDTSLWDPRVNPFYLEFFGETSPLLDSAFSEVIPADGEDVQPASSAPVYEYWWTLGHPGAAPHREQYYGLLGPPPGTPNDPGAPIWENLNNDVAARVYLYFPISGGWRVREIVATVKYLMPLPQHRDWWALVQQDLQLLSPLLDDAGAIAGLVPGGATPSKWLQTIGSLQVASVPQTRDYPWSVEKVTTGGRGHEIMQGVVWNLPGSLMRDQGGRVTGSLAVTLYPAPQQTLGQVRTSLTAPPVLMAQLPAKAHAVAYPNVGDPIWIPGQDATSFIELQISPQLSGAAEPGQGSALGT
jgi:hypothetical protein